MSFFIGMPAHALVIDFENQTAQGLAPLANNYLGFDWSGGDWELVSDTYYTTTYTNSYDSPNGSYAINSAVGLSSIKFTHTNDFNLFTLDASTFAGSDSFVSYSSRTLTVEGFNNGVLVGSQVLNLSSNTYDNFAVNLLNIDEVRFGSAGSNLFWVADNFEVEFVPAPATLALVGLGIAGIGYGRRKQAKAV